MNSGLPGPPGEDAWRPPYEADNDMSGTNYGNVFQARDVAGGIHVHNYYGETLHRAPPPHLLATPPMASTRPVRETPGVAKLAWLWLWRWFVSFLPALLVALLPGYAAQAIVGDGTYLARFASLLIGLSLLGGAVLVGWIALRNRTGRSLWDFALLAVDRLAFRRLGTLHRFARIAMGVCAVGLLITGVIQQPRPTTDGGPESTAGALLFVALVLILTVRRLLVDRPR